MSAYYKLMLFLQEELRHIHALNPDLTLRTESERTIIAQHLSGSIIDEGPSRFRSGRRLSDRVRDKLLDIQKWVIRKP